MPTPSGNPSTPGTAGQPGLKPSTVPTPAAAVQQPQPMAAINPSPAGGPDATQTPGGPTLQGLPAQTAPQSPGTPPGSAQGTAPTSLTDPVQDVSSRLQGIIGDNSVLARHAMTRGRQYAQQRGLLNSSLAADASHRALLDFAVPLAQSDAQVNMSDADRRLDVWATEQGVQLDWARLNSAETQAEKDRELDRQLQEGQIGFEREKLGETLGFERQRLRSEELQAEAQRELQRELTTQEIESLEQRASAEISQRDRELRSQELQAQAQRELQRELTEQEIQSLESRAAEEIGQRDRELQVQQKLSEMELDTRERIEGSARETQEAIAKANQDAETARHDEAISHQTQKSIADAVAGIQTSHDRQYQAILLSTALDEESRAAQVESLRNWTHRQILLIEGTFNTDLDWAPSGEGPGEEPLPAEAPVELPAETPVEPAAPAPPATAQPASPATAQPTPPQPAQPTPPQRPPKPTRGDWVWSGGTWQEVSPGR